MKIYTKTGDDGTTGLFGGPRVRKDHLRIEAYGTVDELNALLGTVRAHALPSDLDAALARIQNELFELGAELATPDVEQRGTATLSDAQIGRLEQEIDSWDAKLAPLTQFILPAGTHAAAGLHLARTVCRRAERRLIAFENQQPLRPELNSYLNRLSDWLFVLARVANQQVGRPDVPWKKPG